MCIIVNCTFLHCWAALSNTNALVPSREVVCTNFMMVIDMTLSGREPTTLRMRGRHADH